MLWLRPISLLLLVQLQLPSFVTRVKGQSSTGRCLSNSAGNDFDAFQYGRFDKGCPNQNGNEEIVPNGLPTMQDVICQFEWESLLTLVRQSPLRQSPYVYHLCPNTIYPAYDFITDTNNFLTAALDQTIYRCGNHGSSQDNCVVEGGSFQVYLRDNPPEVLHTVRIVRFEGITFRGASTMSIGVAAGPNMTVAFVDCIFQEQEAIVYQFYDPPTPGRRNRGRKTTGISSNATTNQDIISNTSIIFYHDIFQNMYDFRDQFDSVFFFKYEKLFPCNEKLQ